MPSESPVAKYSLEDLLRIMARLRDPETGCPWDVKQSFKSIVPFTLEECYELAAAIESEDYDHVADELGDVLFQVVFYAQLGHESRLFDFADVVDGVCTKLLRRHPHVFADGEIEGVVQQQTTATAVKVQWEAIKSEERATRALLGALDDVPTALPALPRAQKLQKRASRVGFDWQTLDGVVDKLEEEVAELRDALARQNMADSAEELGDVMFSAVNLSRHIDCDAETVLRDANAKFERRFAAMEAVAKQESLELRALSTDEWERLWRHAKQADQDVGAG